MIEEQKVPDNYWTKKIPENIIDTEKYIEMEHKLDLISRYLLNEGDISNVFFHEDELKEKLKGKYNVIKELGRNEGTIRFLCIDNSNNKYFLKIIIDNQKQGIIHKQELKFADFLNKDNVGIIKLLESAPFKFEKKYREQTKELKGVYEIYPYYKNTVAESEECCDSATIKDIIIPQLSEAINLLHTNHFSHRDIRPENIMWDSENKQIKLTGFDVAIQFVSKDELEMTCSPYNYKVGYSGSENKENCGQRYYHPNMDYYAMGISVLRLLLNNGKEIWNGKSENEIIELAKKREFPLENSKFNYQEMEINTDEVELWDDLTKIKSLIIGTTSWELSDRWGNNEIKKWITSEGKLKWNASTKGIWKVNGAEYTSLEEFVNDFGVNWDEQHKNYFINDIWKYDSGIDELTRNNICDVVDFVKEGACSKDSYGDVIYCLCLAAMFQDELWWKGKRYKTLRALAYKFNDSQEYDEEWAELLRIGGCEKLIKLSHIEERERQKKIDRAEPIHQLSNKNIQVGFWSFVYSELDMSEGYRIYMKLKGRKQELSEYWHSAIICMFENNEDALNDLLNNNVQFEAYCRVQGYPIEHVREVAEEKKQVKICIEAMLGINWKNNRYINVI